MARRASRTLLTPRNKTLAALEREKLSLLTPVADAPVEELLRRGMRLSHEAAELRRAVKSGDARPAT